MLKRLGFERLAAAAFAVMVIASLAAVRPASAEDAPKAAEAPKPAEKTYAERRAADGPWAKGADWLSFGAGYARAGGKNAGDGMGGYGVRYLHMINSRYSFGAGVSHEVLGHLGSSYEVAVPFTAEFTRHFRWNTAIRPYLGVGGGYYFHKYYRTKSDYTGAPGGGWQISTGANLPLDDRHVLGIDARVGFVRLRGQNVVNPVFGPEPSTESQWAVKLTWAVVR